MLYSSEAGTLLLSVNTATAEYDPENVFEENTQGWESLESELDFPGLGAVQLRGTTKPGVISGNATHFLAWQPCRVAACMAIRRISC